MTITVVDFASAPSLRDKQLLLKTFRLRDQVVNGQLNWHMPSWQGMEHDQSDTLATNYLLYVGKGGAVLGHLRIAPTKYPNFENSMVASAFPQTVNGPVPHGENIGEASRLVLAPELSENPKLRTKVLDELALAAQERALELGWSGLIGIMPPKVWQSVFVKRGWPVEPLGPETWIVDEADKLVNDGKEKPADGKSYSILTCNMPVSEDILQAMRDKLGIHKSILKHAPALHLSQPGMIGRSAA